MERFVLASILGRVDFDLLISDRVETRCGDWGESMEIRLGSGAVFVCIDENKNGFVTTYELPGGKRKDSVIVDAETLEPVMKKAITEAVK